MRGELGFCKTGRHPIISSYSPHFGEEEPLVGTGGSGTVFVTNCNLRCVFCQNWDISHDGQGQTVAVSALSHMMIRLQSMGCHNINFVSPSHIVPQILAALPLAVRKGLRLPLVYNTGGYDRVETIHLLDGVFDIYMPDFKFWNPQSAETCLLARDYPEAARNALQEMHRQVGELQLDERGIAMRGLLVRHLVMPGHAEDTSAIMKFLSSSLSPDTYVNMMAQYRPCGDAYKYLELNRGLEQSEYAEAVNAARNAGLRRLDSRRPRFMFEWL